jgi:hypothetical protein
MKTAGIAGLTPDIEIPAIHPNRVLGNARLTI